MMYLFFNKPFQYSCYCFCYVTSLKKMISCGLQTSFRLKVQQCIGQKKKSSVFIHWCAFWSMWWTACTLSHLISPVRFKSQTNSNKQDMLWHSRHVLSNTVLACCFWTRLRLGLFGACRLPTPCHTQGNCTTVPNKSQMAFWAVMAGRDWESPLEMTRLRLLCF